MIEIHSFDGNDPMLYEMANLNCLVFIGLDYSSKDLDQITGTFQKHSTYPGFTGVKALSENGKMIGFAYGYESTAGQFYRSMLEGQLTEEQTRVWLSDCFEFVELAVAPSARYNGIGNMLHDKLIGHITNGTSVLTTEVGNTPAISLYTKKGWEVIKSDAPVLSTDSLQLIMGKKCS